MGSSKTSITLGFIGAMLIGQSFCWHGWSLQPAGRAPGGLFQRDLVHVESHGRLSRFNEHFFRVRTPWLHVANPAIRGRQQVDYGLRTGTSPLDAAGGLLGIIQKDIQTDVRFQKDVQARLGRILEQNEQAYVRNSHSAYIRQSMSQELRTLTDQAWGGLQGHFVNVQVDRIKAPMEHLKKEIEGSDGWKKAAPFVAPVGGAAVAAYLLYTGQAVNWTLPGGVTLGTQQHLASAAGRFSLGTPWFSADVTYSVNAPDARDPSLPTPEDTIQASEKVRVAIGHTIPVIGLNTSFSYATTTGTLSAALSRNLLIPNLTGSVSTTRSVRPTAGGNYGEESVQLSYGSNF